MADTKKSGRGGARPGPGRKPALTTLEKKVPRQVILSPLLWAEIDAAQENLGITCTAFIEQAVRQWLLQNACPGVHYASPE